MSVQSNSYLEPSNKAIMGNVELHEGGKKATAQVTWNNKTFQISVQFSSKADLKKATKHLEKSLSKMLALADVYKLGGNESSTKKLELSSKNKLTRYYQKETEPELSKKTYKKDVVSHLKEKIRTVEEVGENDPRKEQIQKAIDVFKKNIKIPIESETRIGDLTPKQYLDLMSPAPIKSPNVFGKIAEGVQYAVSYVGTFFKRVLYATTHSMKWMTDKMLVRHLKKGLEDASSPLAEKKINQITNLFQEFSERISETNEDLQKAKQKFEMLKPSFNPIFEPMSQNIDKEMKKKEKDPRPIETGPILDKSLKSVGPIGSPPPLTANDEALLHQSLAKIDKPPQKDQEASAFQAVMSLSEKAEVFLADIKSNPPQKLDLYLLEVNKMYRLLSQMNELQSVLGKEPIPKNIVAAYDAIKTIRTNFEKECDLIQQQMIDFAQANYRGNPAIPGDGNCMFWSFSYQLGGTQKDYRKTAAEYIREHKQDFSVGIRDFFHPIEKGKNLHLPHYSFIEYVEKQGGLEAFHKNLMKKLGREPDQVDYYCDCMENSQFWGGTMEVQALSNALGRPVISFQPSQHIAKKALKQWDIYLQYNLNFMETGKKPVILYYNGDDHYQQLIPK